MDSVNVDQNHRRDEHNWNLLKSEDAGWIISANSSPCIASRTELQAHIGSGIMQIRCAAQVIEPEYKSLRETILEKGNEPCDS